MAASKILKHTPMDEDEHCITASDDSVASDDGSDDMFDIFTGDAIDTMRPFPDTTHDAAADDDDDDDDDEWADVALMDQDDLAEDTAHQEETLGAWITLPPEEKPPPTVDELRAINAGADEPFEYTEVLCSDEQTIRIIDILPGGPDHGLSLMMRTTQLSGPSKDYYIAVTHAGDTSGECVKVPCNGKLLPVPKGIHAALLHIGRHLDTGIWSLFGSRPCIWIDALSLEHHDRSWRARNESNLFRRAERVLIWLGNYEVPSTPGMILAVDDLDLEAMHLGEAGEQQFKSSVPNRDETEKILQDPWFKARASLQPFAATRRRTILLPDGRAFDIARFQQILQDYGLENSSGPMSDIRLFDSSRPQRSLIANLHHYAAMECETPHDTVYTLLGISCGCQHAMSATQCGVKNCGLRDTSISYKQPIDELFRDIASRALGIDPVAVFVSTCLRQPGNQSWPSWVPDWRIAPKHASPLTRRCIDESFGSDFEKLLWNDGFRMHDMQRWQCNPKCRPNNCGPYGWAIRVEQDTLKMIGWPLQRPPARTKVTELTWSENVAHRSRMRTPSWAEHFSSRRHGQFLQPTESYVKLQQKMSEKERQCQTISGAWPRLTVDDVVIFILGSRVSFIVRSAGQSVYRLVDCIARPVALTNTRFAWLDENGEVWAYGDCTRAPVELELA